MIGLVRLPHHATLQTLRALRLHRPAEDMLLSAATRRDKAAADADASELLRSVRDRLEVTASGLGELEFLRQRQEELVRAALELREDEEQRQRTARVSSGEKLLEENILLLRKQLVGPHLSVT